MGKGCPFKVLYLLPASSTLSLSPAFHTPSRSHSLTFSFLSSLDDQGWLVPCSGSHSSLSFTPFPFPLSLSHSPLPAAFPSFFLVLFTHFLLLDTTAVSNPLPPPLLFLSLFQSLDVSCFLLLPLLVPILQQEQQRQRKA